MPRAKVYNISCNNLHQNLSNCHGITTAYTSPLLLYNDKNSKVNLLLSLIADFRNDLSGYVLAGYARFEKSDDEEIDNPPIIDSITPDKGSIYGGTTITITGE